VERTHTEVSNRIETLKHYGGGIAFPIPAGAPEVLWNLRRANCYTFRFLTHDGCGLFANGERAHDAYNYGQSNPFDIPKNPVGIITIDRSEADHSIPCMDEDKFTLANLPRSASR
jgi:hypothetical protein